MEEAYKARFVELLEQGAAVQDVHDSPAPLGYAVSCRSSDEFIRRELGRVDQHRRNACWLLEEYVGPVGKILDAGCGTGGFSVALASSPKLRPTQVIGIDASRLTIEAARSLGISLPIPDGMVTTISRIAPWQNRLFQKRGPRKMVPFDRRANPHAGNLG